MNREAIRDLCERTDKGSYELDALILCATIAPTGSKVEQSPINGAWCIYEPQTYGKEPFRLWPKPRPWNDEQRGVTSSVDAALALVERVLPGALWTIEADACWLHVLTKDDVAEHQAAFTQRGGKATPLAIICALLKALLLSKEPTDV
jgi:hypothetical protein